MSIIALRATENKLVLTGPVIFDFATIWWTSIEREIVTIITDFFIKDNTVSTRIGALSVNYSMWGIKTLETVVKIGLEAKLASEWISARFYIYDWRRIQRSYWTIFSFYQMISWFASKTRSRIAWNTIQKIYLTKLANVSR